MSNLARLAGSDVRAGAGHDRQALEEVIVITNAQLVNVTYGQAENWFHQGYITADQWAGFRTAWRRSAPHLSSLGSECEGPQAPEVEAIAAEIKAAHDAQRAAPRAPASFGFPTNI